MARCGCRVLCVGAQIDEAAVEERTDAAGGCFVPHFFYARTAGFAQQEATAMSFLFRVNMVRSSFQLLPIGLTQFLRVEEIRLMIPLDRRP